MRKAKAMDRQEQPERAVIDRLEDIPEFASEDEERAWWATHDIAEELGRDATQEQRARIRRAARRARPRPVPVTTVRPSPVGQVA
ncbi:MAG: hypothetical protein GW802_36435 [Armatimonadetes bacterium]|nr:hypothetical protein [Armatimonadota bacterium]NCQ32837.1 hypothetical protein [Armatimonadota bacterium]